MIRLGTLAGYPFEGPRVLAGWTPPSVPAVFAVLFPPDPDGQPERYAVIYVGESADLRVDGFPFRHHASSSWIRRAGDKWQLRIAWYEVPGGLPSHRTQIVQELLATYRPTCNTEKYDNTWEPEWIGDYETPTQDPLTTGRSLDRPSSPPPANGE